MVNYMNTEKEVCPVCGMGHLDYSVRENTLEYKSAKIKVLSRYSVCDICEVEQTSPAQLKENKRSYNEAKKRFDGFLTGKELREIRENYFKITQQDAAKIFGGGPVAFSKYESDDVIQSESMDKLLRVAYSVPQAFLWLSDFSVDKHIEPIINNIVTFGMKAVTGTSFRPKISIENINSSRFYSVVNAQTISSVISAYTPYIDAESIKCGNDETFDYYPQIAVG